MMLTAKQARKLFRYDAESGRLYRKTTCGRHRAGAPAGWCWNINGESRWMVSVGSHEKRKVYPAARVIWLIVTGEWPKYEIDHIDGNPSNDRWGNLRDVPTTINARNKRIICTNTSGMMGVRWNTEKNKWQARIKFNKKEKHLGYFDQYEEACKARKRAEARYGFHKNHGRPSDCPRTYTESEAA